MDLYDKLPLEVKQALWDALAPWSVAYVYDQLQGRSVSSVIAEINRMDQEQHRNAKMAGVVPDAPKGFKIRPRRSPRRIR